MNPHGIIINAAENMDWQQVVLNGGPPCFHIQPNGRFCGRAKLWIGHKSPQQDHCFISLADLLDMDEVELIDRMK